MGPTVLSWLPAPSRHGQSWHEQSAKPPLAVVCGNIGCTLSSLHRHISLLHSAGCDVAVFTPHPLALWAPAWAAADARAVLAELERHLACHTACSNTRSSQPGTNADRSTHAPVRPVLWLIMSGSSKAVYAHILSELGQGQPLRSWQDTSLLAQDLAQAAHMREALHQQRTSEALSNAAGYAALESASVQGSSSTASSLGPVQQQAVQAAQAALKQVMPKPWQHTGWGGNMHTDSGYSYTASPYNARPHSALPIGSADSSASPASPSYTSLALSKLGSWVQSAARQASRVTGLSSPDQAQGYTSVHGLPAVLQSLEVDEAKRSGGHHSSVTSYPLAAASWCGQWFDSSPVDFTSPSGVAMVEVLLGGPPRRSKSKSSTSSGTLAAQSTSQHSTPQLSYSGQAPLATTASASSRSAKQQGVGGPPIVGAVQSQAASQQLAAGAPALHPQGPPAASAPPTTTSPAGAPSAPSQGQGPLAAARSSVLRGVAAAVDFMGFEAWESQRRWMWGVLAGSPVVMRGPTLLTYSWDDAVADPLRIHLFAHALRSRGCLVLEQAWESSPHCGHLKAHPQEAEAAVRQWLMNAQAVWRLHHQADRSAAPTTATKESAQPAQQVRQGGASQAASGINPPHHQSSKPLVPNSPEAPQDWAGYYAAQAMRVANSAAGQSRSLGSLYPEPSTGAFSPGQQLGMAMASGRVSYLQSKL